MFKQLEVPILGIVENMSYLDLPDGTRMDIFGSGGGEELAQATDTTFLGKVPIDQNVRIGGDTGKPIVVSHPEFAGCNCLAGDRTEDRGKGQCGGIERQERIADQYCGIKNKKRKEAKRPDRQNLVRSFCFDKLSLATFIWQHCMKECKRSRRSGIHAPSAEKRRYQ